MGDARISPPILGGQAPGRQGRDRTGVRRLDAGWGPPPLSAIEPVLFLDLEPDPTHLDLPTLVEFDELDALDLEPLDLEPDSETDTFMMVDLVFDQVFDRAVDLAFDEESGARDTGMQLAKLEPSVPQATTGAPRASSRSRASTRWPLGKRRPRGPAPWRPNPTDVHMGPREPFPAALSDLALASLIEACTEELCG